MCSWDLSCHSMSLLRSPITSLADSWLSLVNGTKHSCIWGLRSSIWTTAKKILSAPTSFCKNSSARLKYFSISSLDRRSKNSGLAVTMVSMNLTLSLRTLHCGFSFCPFRCGAGLNPVNAKNSVLLLHMADAFISNLPGIFACLQLFRAVLMSGRNK